MKTCLCASISFDYVMLMFVFFVLHKMLSCDSRAVDCCRKAVRSHTENCI